MTISQTIGNLVEYHTGLNMILNRETDRDDRGMAGLRLAQTLITAGFPGDGATKFVSGQTVEAQFAAEIAALTELQKYAYHRLWKWYTARMSATLESARHHDGRITQGE